MNVLTQKLMSCFNINIILKVLQQASSLQSLKTEMSIGNYVNDKHHVNIKNDCREIDTLL